MLYEASLTHVGIIQIRYMIICYYQLYVSTYETMSFQQHPSLTKCSLWDLICKILWYSRLNNYSEILSREANRSGQMSLAWLTWQTTKQQQSEPPSRNYLLVVTCHTMQLNSLDGATGTYPTQQFKLIGRCNSRSSDNAIQSRSTMQFQHVRQCNLQFYEASIDFRRRRF